jgi:hypothetical protein
MFASRFKEVVLAAMIAAGVTSCGSGGQRSEASEDDSTLNSRNASRNFAHSEKGWLESFKIYVADNVPAEVLPATQNAIRTLNLALNTELIQFAGITANPSRSPGLYSSLDDEENMILYDPEWSANTGKKLETLATTVWESDVDDVEILAKADVILNAAYFFVDAFDVNLEGHERQYEMVDAESVILHELCHLIGLDHIPSSIDPGSVMIAETFYGLGIAKRTLSQGDKERLLTIYKGNAQ